MPVRIKIEGATVFVVGASQGIGLACAKRFASTGAKVTLFARRGKLLESARAEVAESGCGDGARAHCYELDATSLHATRRVMADAVAQVGAPDILLNCVGRARPGRFSELSDAALQGSLDANLVSMWNTVRVLLPSLERTQGHVVNTASIAGFVGVYGFTDYCASKFAVMGFSEALRSELRPRGIGVSVLCPPDTETPGFEIENQTKPAQTRAISESAKPLSPDAVARALIAGLERGRKIIIPGLDGKLIWYAKRFAPALVEWTMNRAIRRASA